LKGLTKKFVKPFFFAAASAECAWQKMFQACARQRCAYRHAASLLQYGKPSKLVSPSFRKATISAKSPASVSVNFKLQSRAGKFANQQLRAGDLLLYSPGMPPHPKPGAKSITGHEQVTISR